MAEQSDAFAQIKGVQNAKQSAEEVHRRALTLDPAPLSPVTRRPALCRLAPHCTAARRLAFPHVISMRSVQNRLTLRAGVRRSWAWAVRNGMLGNKAEGEGAPLMAAQLAKVSSLGKLDVKRADQSECRLALWIHGVAML